MAKGLPQIDALKIRLEDEGDRCILIHCAALVNPIQSVNRITHLIIDHQAKWMRDIAPGLDSILIHLDFQHQIPQQIRDIAKQDILNWITQYCANEDHTFSIQNTTHLLRVCYDPAVAPDLMRSAEQCQISVRELIERHKNSKFTADMIGFMPGFAYFSGLDPKLSLPRLSTPRPLVPAGSVAIVGEQTVIYPSPSPGGWNLIGQCPDRLFDPQKNPPTLFRPGDQIQIQEISLRELKELEAFRQVSPRSEKVIQKDIEVLSVGLLTTIQDLPRYGMMHIALSPGGAVDQAAMHLANALVGNEGDEAVLEMTSSGAKLWFHKETLIAWVGAQCDVLMNQQTLRSNRPTWVKADSIVEFKHFHHGFRIVMAIAGGIDAPEVLGRRGTHLFANLGPKKIKKGDFLGLKKPTQAFNRPYLQKLHQSSLEIRAAKWSIASPYVSDAEVIDVFAMNGQQLHLLTELEQQAFWRTIWTVSSQSNRMGIRLQGDFSIQTTLSGISSQGLTFGTIQLPSSGEPIIMLCEHQTTGGYPKLAEVIESEQSKLAQLKPGQKIRLQPIQVADADKMNIDFQEEIHARLKGIRIVLEEKN